MQFSPVRTAIIIAVTLLGFFFALPSFLPQTVRDAWPSWLPSQTIVLGLDLQGGSHLLLEVNQDGIVTERLADLRRDARSILANDNGIGNLITTDEVSRSISIELTDPTQADTALTALASLQNSVGGTLFSTSGVQELTIEPAANGRITVALTQEGIDDRMSALVAQSIEVIRNRIDELGTTEPTIQRQGNNRVLVQVPGFGDSTRLKDIISRTARLTFHMVYPGMTAAQADAQGLPAGTMILPSQDGGSELLYEDIALGGESLVDAQPSYDQQRAMPVVSFRFDTRGAIAFGQITSNNVGQRFAIVLDNQVITAPVIQSPITGGSGQISGSFTTATANDLAVLLRGGALPASLDIVEERSVSAGLGADSIRAGVTAGIIGAIAVIVFMVIAYGLFGVFADIAVMLNVVLILAALSMLGATLTLPGIAGIVLTIGMAVDANVLIFERIREELAAGRSKISAIEAGFQRAMATILDANITTLIAAVVLFYLGSGPVQGFAVTLALGILTTLFTAYMVTLFIVGRWYNWARPKTLRIQLVRLIPDGTKISFMGIRKYAIAFSIITSILSLGWFGYHGLNLGIDFRGGSAMEIQATDGTAEPGAIREALSALDLGEIQVQGFGETDRLLVRVQTQDGGASAQQDAVNLVQQTIEDAGYVTRGTETVGPTVSSELAITGAIGLGVALLGILVYLWFRFEWQFAVGAIISTGHDVILTIGLFAFVGLEFNASSIAAILTIVGYSLNDTVVIYDRIREYRMKYKKIGLPEIIDISINSTLPRTILTASTTFIALMALVVFGGDVIRSFTISMAWGVLVGTYSSIFIAAPILIYLGVTTRLDQAGDKDGTELTDPTDGAAV
ncbi:protein translocase subunit SecD [Devosia neptuniae]|uniref:protein translocase subunit SecD n=2 Tax=Devosia TaxID=46913 RepID=UPI0022AF6566|nr:protein translocase subunit SecD [Devosia neptuniae]MCZ4346321.1 protein translocase subunit SecD [Devosia neptuniae]|tara:strand:+ start:61646 stop:64207 length:2562 start_codon:yes stop_codon:yes gene_type:complete